MRTFAFNTATLLIVTIAAIAISPYVQRGPILLLFSATIFCSLFSGLFAGGITAVAAALIHTYFFQNPPASFSVESKSDLFELILFLGMAFFVGWFGSLIRDSRIRAERLAAQAEEAARSREELLAIVAHDLKNPLSSIQLSVRLAERNEKARDSPQLMKSLETIATTSARMMKIISDLLDYEKVRVGTFRVEPRPESVRNLLAEVREIMAPMAGPKSQQLKIELPPEDYQVCCDRERMIQVFSNLIGNAIKFTAPGGKISVGCVAGSENVTFFVRDTGPGLSQEQIDHVFERYWQGRPTSRQGTGLGLSIVKGIVQSHQGSVWVQSRVHEGSTFYFAIPRVQAPHAMKSA